MLIRMQTNAHRPRLLSLVLVLFATVGPAFAERSVLQEEDGITVEEQPEPGRTLPVLFGTTSISAPPERIAEWIEDVRTYPDWQHNCEEARALPQPDGTTLTYNRVGAPWPVSDRDVVLASTRVDGEDGRILIEFHETEAANAPKDTGAVRMPRLRGSYDLTPTESGTHVVYMIDSDPGGSLPTWLVRQASKDLPYETLKNLRARAEAGPPPTGDE